MPTETVATNASVVSDSVPVIVQSQEDEALRKLALRHPEHVPKFKIYRKRFGVPLRARTA